MKNYYFSYCLIFLLPLFFACSSEKKSESPEDGVMTVLPDAKNEVSVETIKTQVFNHELVSNGKVMAKGVADLRFQSNEVVAHIWVKNGDRVKKGQKIAELDKFRLTNKYEQAKDALERAELDLQDVLIGQGYGLIQVSDVPAEVMQLAKVKSGYDQSKAQYELAEYELRNAALIAPFDGVVANLFAKPHNLPSTTDVFCTIIDSQGMEVDFSVLENELPLIKSGDKVVITPYAGTSSVYAGSISEINPLVDDKGMVRVRARVNGNSKLFTGMNVRVSVQRAVGEQLVIPKSAVVLRSGKQVVFTLKDGKAFWNYVQTGLENAGYYTIIEGLQEGEEVIVSGNINLAHEAPVTIIQ